MTEKFIKSSGNVFKDIGVPDPERTLLRSKLMSYITDIIKERGLNQTQAAKLLKLSQSRVSNLMNGKLSVFSLEHLFRLLTALEQDVEIKIRPRSRSGKKRASRTRVLITV